jgi:hypothetical protein
VSSRAAEIQVLLEGVALPATKQELLDYALRQSCDGWELALIEELPEQAYASLDEVGEALSPVQPARRMEQPEPKPESGLPPGGEAYTDPSAEPGAVRER